MTGPKVVVLGLDGATLDLIRPWADAGALPNLKALMDSGATGKLRSTLPYVTPLAWPAIYTGTNPGKHGLLGFRSRVPDAYKWRLNTYSDVVRPAIWDLLGRHEMESGVFFVPFTFPVKPLRGVMISGAFGPGKWEDRSFYPPERLAAFKERFADSSLFAPRKQEGMTLAQTAERMIEGIEQQTAAMNMAFRENDFDFVFLVWHDTDKVAHLFWHFSDLPCPDVDSPMCRVYQAVDRGIGRLLDTLGGEPLVIACSDHGTYPIRYRVQAHVWLAREGWLQPKTSARSVSRLARTWNKVPARVRGMVPLEARKAVYGKLSQPPASPREGIGPVDWEHTKAYVGPGTGESFWLNVAGREPRGIVPPERFEEESDALAAALEKIQTPDGRPAVEAVRRREELYSGPASGLGPDLVAETSLGTMLVPSVRLLASVDTAELISVPKKPDFDSDVPRPLGYHQRDGVVIFSGPGVRARDDLYAEVTDIVPTILRYLDLPAPRDLDGSAIEDGFDALPEARWSEDDFTGSTEAAPDLTAEEEADIADHLRQLGYLE